MTVQLPELLYQRLWQTAQAMRQPFDAVLAHAVEVGSPPDWTSAPAEFQADLAALDRLDDSSLWQIARSYQTEEGMIRYQELLDKNANEVITAAEQLELDELRREADRFMLRKAQAAALLHWRGHSIPPSDQL